MQLPKTQNYRRNVENAHSRDLQFAMIVDRLLGNLINRVVNLHDSSLITASVTIIRSREYCDNLPIVLPLVSFHHQLMGTRNEMESVDVSELLCDILAESISSSPR